MVTADALAEGVTAGRRDAIARTISILERGSGPARSLEREIFSRATGEVRVIGLTGPPGAGKSTLVDQLVAALVRREHRVAVLAVDPSSPFTGGAVLGDRVRMREHPDAAGVYFRSVASRGRLGGARAGDPRRRPRARRGGLSIRADRDGRRRPERG